MKNGTYKFNFLSHGLPGKGLWKIVSFLFNSFHNIPFQLIKLIDEMCQQYDPFQARAVEVTKEQPQDDSLTRGVGGKSQKKLTMFKSIFCCLFGIE